MGYWHQLGWLRLVAIALIVVVGLTDFGLGIYHLTHEGVGSGVTEVIMAVALGVAAHLIIKAQKK